MPILLAQAGAAPRVRRLELVLIRKPEKRRSKPRFEHEDQYGRRF